MVDVSQRRPTGLQVRAAGSLPTKTTETTKTTKSTGILIDSVVFVFLVFFVTQRIVDVEPRPRRVVGHQNHQDHIDHEDHKAPGRESLQTSWSS
jgi:hypothetical protein